jgi:hypothetical protein
MILLRVGQGAVTHDRVLRNDRIREMRVDDDQAVRSDAGVADGAALPPLARWLGYAGLLPQIAALAVLASGSLYWRSLAQALAFAYAALILSFLGGLWWGLAAQARRPAPRWTWVAAVIPSLLALLSALPWAIGEPWPGPSLGWLGLFLLGSLLVDHRLGKLGLAPPGWMALRIPLSLGLGVLTLAAACL